MKTINIKKITPQFTGLVTTMDKYEEYTTTKGGVIVRSKSVGTLKEYQTVIAVGPNVRDIKVGDLVAVNPTRFSVKTHKEGTLKDNVITDNPVTSYQFDVIKLDGKECLLLQDRDIDFIVNEYEYVEEENGSVTPPSSPSPLYRDWETLKIGRAHV